jgi:arylsulfatase A-like enzyme
MRLRATITRLCVALVVAAAVACGADAGGGTGTGSRGTPPNVLVIVVDTLRADHLGCYGHDRPTSPSIDGLAASGVRFEHAYSAAPWTMPAVASMLTGLPPAAHAVETLRHMLPDNATTLAERLSEHGYATAAVVSHMLVSSRYGFDQGYEVFDEREAQGHDHVSTPGVTATASALLRLLAGGERPFFLFVHYFDPHFNYLPHAEFDFAPTSVGTLDGTQGIEELRARLDELTPQEFAFLTDLYDEEIRLTDDGVGVLMGQLDALGLADSTLVVLTADHGEEFGERGWLGHVNSLHDELVRVPLIVRRPGERRRNVVVPAPVSTMALAPTVLDLLGLAVRSESFLAPSLRRWLEDPSADAPGPVYSAVNMARLEPGDPRLARLSGVVHWPHKLVHDEAHGTRRLYHLVDDPGELDDIASERPGVAAFMGTLLEAWARDAEARSLFHSVLPLEPADEALLEGLGYLGR